MADRQVTDSAPGSHAPTSTGVVAALGRLLAHVVDYPERMGDGQILIEHVSETIAALIAEQRHRAHLDGEVFRLSTSRNDLLGKLDSACAAIGHLREAVKDLVEAAQHVHPDGGPPSIRQAVADAEHALAVTSGYDADAVQAEQQAP